MEMVLCEEFRDYLDIGLPMMHKKLGKYTRITSTVHRVQCHGNNTEYPTEFVDVGIIFPCDLTSIIVIFILTYI